MARDRVQQRGQHVMEYAILIAVVATALTAMVVYVRRSVQANTKNLEQELNAGVDDASIKVKE